MSIILHLDMNSYFASLEQQANPHLRGRAVGVCEHLGGIIIAPSVEAKRMGIVMGTPVWEARKICPQIVLLPVDPPKCRAVTERFNRILQDYGDEVERYSIDESFIDITETCGGNWDDALLLGLAIKQRLRREVGEWVSASIGIGPNKLLAKIAAELDGGVILEGLQNDKKFLDRICMVRPQDIETLYDRLCLTDIPGIGKRMERALNKLGIYTLRQLRDYPLGNLLNQFGIGGWVLKQLALFDVIARSDGDETRPNDSVGRAIPLETRLPRPEHRPRNDNGGNDRPKSVGHAYTLPRVITDSREIKGLMMKLSEKVGRRMRRAGARGQVVSYFHSDKFYHSFHKQRRLREPISDGREIYRAALRNFYSSPDHALAVKIMGITVSDLFFFAMPEPLLWEFKKPGMAVAAMDQVNTKYGDWTVYPARLLGLPQEWGKDTVGFGRTKN